MKLNKAQTRYFYDFIKKIRAYKSEKKKILSKNAPQKENN
jgi:hypothetical protein